MANLRRDEQKFYAEYYKEKHDIDIEIYDKEDMEEEAYASYRKELSDYNTKKEEGKKAFYTSDEFKEHGENIDIIIQEIKQFRARLPEFKKLREYEGEKDCIILWSEAIKKPKTLQTYNNYIDYIQQYYAGKYRFFIGNVKPEEGSEDFDGFKRDILNFIASQHLEEKSIFPPKIDMDTQNAIKNSLLLDKITKTQQGLKEGGACSVLFTPRDMISMGHTTTFIVTKNKVITYMQTSSDKTKYEFLKAKGLNVFTIADDAFYIKKGVPIMQADSSSCATLGLMISKQLLRDDGKALKELLAKAKESGTKELDLTPDILKYSQSNRLVANLNCNDSKLAHNKDNLTVGEHRKQYERKQYGRNQDENLDNRNEKLSGKSEKIKLLHHMLKNANTSAEMKMTESELENDGLSYVKLWEDLENSKLKEKILSAKGSGVCK